MLIRETSLAGLTASCRLDERSAAHQPLKELRSHWRGALEASDRRVLSTGMSQPGFSIESRDSGDERGLGSGLIHVRPALSATVSEVG